MAGKVRNLRLNIRFMSQRHHSKVNKQTYRKEIQIEPEYIKKFLLPQQGLGLGDLFRVCLLYTSRCV